MKGVAMTESEEGVNQDVDEILYALYVHTALWADLHIPEQAFERMCKTVDEKQIVILIILYKGCAKLQSSTITTRSRLLFYNFD